MFVQKKCVKCGRAKRLGIDPPEHDCTINHEGSSGSMEAKLALRLTEEIYRKKNGRVYLQKIVSDDDSTMRSLLRHQKNNDKGKLPIDIPEPLFLADPGHRIKVMSKPFFKMVTTTKDPSTCKMIDDLSIKKYLGCFIYKNRTLPLCEFVNKARAPVEHLFNNHEWCDSEWCFAKALTENAMQQVVKVSTLYLLVFEILFMITIITNQYNILTLYLLFTSKMKKWTFVKQMKWRES